MVPAASREDSGLQAIVKFQPRNSFDYRVHYHTLSQLRPSFARILIFEIAYYFLWKTRNTINNILVLNSKILATL